MVTTAQTASPITRIWAAQARTTGFRCRGMETFSIPAIAMSLEREGKKKAAAIACGRLESETVAQTVQDDGPT